MKLKFANQPVAYEKLLKAVVYLLVGFTVVHWSDAQIVLVLAVGDAVLGVVVWSAVTPNSKVAAQVAEASTSARNQALADVASLPQG